MSSSDSEGGGATVTWEGYLESTNDALLIFEACRLGMLPKIRRRLTPEEREDCVKPGAVFVWDEDESGIKRWTDGRTWSDSRIKGPFLVYQEIPSKPKIRRRKGTSKAQEDKLFAESINADATTSTPIIPKADGLIKKAISVVTADNRKQHLVSYYDKETEGGFTCPSQHDLFKTIIIASEMYPEFTADHNTDVVAGVVLNVGGIPALVPTASSADLSANASPALPISKPLSLPNLGQPRTNPLSLSNIGQPPMTNPLSMSSINQPINPSMFANISANRSPGLPTTKISPSLGLTNLATSLTNPTLHTMNQPTFPSLQHNLSTLTSPINFPTSQPMVLTDAQKQLLDLHHQFTNEDE